MNLINHQTAQIVSDTPRMPSVYATSGLSMRAGETKCPALKRATRMPAARRLIATKTALTTMNWKTDRTARKYTPRRKYG